MMRLGLEHTSIYLNSLNMFECSYAFFTCSWLFITCSCITLALILNPHKKKMKNMFVS